MTPPGSPSLPPETWDFIIDYLHLDKHSLSACGLVHKAWTNSARRRLFQQTTINYESNDLADISQIFPTSGGGVVPHIRELRLLDNPECSSPVEAFPVTMLPRFPSIKSMWLRCPQHGKTPDTVLTWAMPQMENVETLKISMSTGSLDDLLAFISAASSLTSLAICDCTEIEDLSPEQIAQMFNRFTPPPITRLALSFKDFRNGSDYNSSVPVLLVKWIDSHPSREALRTIHVADLHVYGTPALKICLDTIERSIEHLQLRWDENYDLGEYESGIELGRMIKLESISIMVSEEGQLDIIRDMLSRIPSFNLTEIIFELWTSEAIYLWDDLDAMDNYFADVTPKYPAQSAFVRFVCYKTDAGWDEAVHFDGLIKNAFRQTKSQGGLTVEFISGNPEDHDMSLRIEGYQSPILEAELEIE